MFKWWDYGSLSLISIAFYCIKPLTIENKKYPIISIRNKSHKRPMTGFESKSKSLGWWNAYFCFSNPLFKLEERLSLIDFIHPNSTSSAYFLQIVITKSIWMWTFMIALPIKVGMKNFLKGIRKCPHVIPAKSNKGFGMEAHNSIVMNPYFYMLSNMKILALSMKVKPDFCFKCSISLIYSF